MAKFCGVCGAPLDENGKCPNCDKDDAPKQEESKEETKEETASDPNAGADLFCDMCGSKLDPTTGLCPNCSKLKEEPKADLFCDMCGTPIDPKTGLCPNCSKNNVKDLSKETVNNTGKKSKLPIVILVVVLLVAALGAGAYFYFFKGKDASSDVVTNEDLTVNMTKISEYLKENSDIKNEITASTSESMQSENQTLDTASEKGLGKNDLTYICSQTGEELGFIAAKKDSADLHPTYMTSYKASNGNTWSVYFINGETYAATITSSASDSTILTETDHVTVYDNKEDKFYELTPKVDNVYHVDEISSSVLDSIDLDSLPEQSSSDTNTEDTTTIERHVVDMNVWDVQPVYDFDDIDVDFATDFTSIATSYPYTPYFCFNNNNLYTITYEGGFIFVKDGKFGLANGIGEVTMEAKYTNYIDKLESNGIYVVTNTSSDKAEKLKANYYREDEDYLGGMGGTGFPTYAYNSETGVVMEIPDTTWTNEAPSSFDLYSFAVEKGMNEGGITVLTSSSSKGSEYYDGYVIVGDGYTKPLDISTDYKVYAVSENIVTFAKYNNVSGTDSRDYAKRYMVYPLVRDQRITDVVYVDANGNTIASGFETGYPFYEGYAAVKKDGKWGYIDTNGNVVVDFVFDKATPMSNGKAWVIYNGKTGRINLKEMIDNNAIFNDEQIKTDEWTTSGAKYLEVTVDVLKKRDQPTTSGYDDGNRVSKGSIEVYYDKATADGYTWYKTADQLWIADKNGEWIKEIN